MVENNNNRATRDLQLLSVVTAKAGRIAMKYFKAENAVWMKPGDSPVSQADIAVNDYLQQNLMRARPDYGWISEETKDTDLRLDQNIVFVVDPIDGTRGFINEQDQWCISVAVVKNGRPIAAVLECPALNKTFCAVSDSPPTLNGRVLPPLAQKQIRLVTGSKKINSLLMENSTENIAATEFIPSLAYRIALVATGEIDAAFARPGAHEWDLAAADLILTNAGGCLVDKHGAPMEYNSRTLHRPALVACAVELKKTAIKLAKSADILH